ncbi:MAG: hypothetical protein LC754_14475, partial [Acidobacteria bacterium]|nr:hypothetical protein [Acidobacteriota bacterium]
MMDSELFFRVGALALYVVFHLIRAFYALKVSKSGGKVFSGMDDLKRKGAVHAGLGWAMEFILPS